MRICDRCRNLDLDRQAILARECTFSFNDKKLTYDLCDDCIALIEEYKFTATIHLLVTQSQSPVNND